MDRSRKLTVGEINIVSNALFMQQARDRKEAHEYRVAAAPYIASHGEDSEVVRRMVAYAEAAEKRAKITFNLELLFRRYDVTLNSLIVIPEQA